MVSSGEVLIFTFPPDNEVAETPNSEVPVILTLSSRAILSDPLPFVTAFIPFVLPDTLPASTIVVDPVAEFVLIPRPPAEVIVPALIRAILAPVVVRLTPLNEPERPDIEEARLISTVRKSPAVLSVDATLKPTPPAPE